MAALWRWRGEGDGFLAIAPLEIGVDHIALDRPRADDGDLDHQIIHRTRAHARQHVDLRPAFDLEDADRIAPAQHVVDGRILGREIAQAIALLAMAVEKITRLADAGEHAEGEHIDLHQPQRVDIVLVPFDEGTIVHRGVADGHDLVEPALCQNETADMLRQVAREALQAAGETQGAMQHGIVGIEPRLA